MAGYSQAKDLILTEVLNRYNEMLKKINWKEESH